MNDSWFSQIFDPSLTGKRQESAHERRTDEEVA